MSRPEVAVMDYGVGNLLSVRRALEHCGATVTVTAEPRCVLPRAAGGSARGGSLRERHGGAARAAASTRWRGRSRRGGVPLLGICLGMQMLLDESEEFGVTEGLELIPGRVVALSATSTDGAPLKIPHVGWNALLPAPGRESWSDTCLAGVGHAAAVYFVHSFAATPSDPRHRVADCRYGGHAIAAVIARRNVVGCQFHPEKSGEVGLKVLRGFLAP